MNSSKEQYFDTLRNNSAYPVYRATIGIIAMLGYLLAGLYALGALIMGFGSMFNHAFFMGVGILILGAIMAGLVFFFAKLFKEAALIIVDMGDSTIEANSRTKPA